MYHLYLALAGDHASGEQAEGEPSQEDGSQPKKKAKRKKKVIETDLKKINIPDVEHSYEVSTIHSYASLFFFVIDRTFIFF